MLLAFTAADYVVLAFYLLMMIVVGAYFSRQQHTSGDFFLAGRSMSWFPVGLSIMATLLSALSYTGIPAEASSVGLLLLLSPLATWLTLPLVVYVVIPLYHRLDIFSIYEYLEFRFDLATRVASSGVFVLWRLLWLGGVLYAPCKVLVVAAGLEVDLWVLLVTLGAVGTLYTFLGGMKAVIWTDVIQSLVMVAGLALIIGGVAWYIEGGLGGVWESAGQLRRTQLFQVSWDADTSSFWSEKWLLWGMLPHLVLGYLSFYVADQITAQRFLTTSTLSQGRRSFVLNCISVSIMVPALVWAGISLSVFYQSHPEALRLHWVLRQDDSAQSVASAPPRKGHTDVADELEALLAAGAILDPNTGEPIENTAELMAMSREQLIDRLSQRDPITGERRILRGRDELMPHFIATYLPAGIAGLILAALLAASMSSMDSGLNSITTLAVMDFYRRLGWGRGAVARWRRKPVDALSEDDELWLGRVLVVIIGAAATLFSLWVSQIESSIFDVMIRVVNTFGAPLLGIFLLGMFTRRTTAAGALVGLAGGVLMTPWLVFAPELGMWPWQVRLNPIWPVTFGLGFTLLLGYAASLVVGRVKSAAELDGLVVWLGKLGERRRT
ncbi:MAG: hypothetical protein WDZ59_10970 [Pirellulales bacterium]